MSSVKFGQTNIRVVSGSFKGTLDELERQAMDSLYNGLSQGMLQAITAYQPQLAQRTGRFRNAFAASVLSAVQKRLGDTTISVNKMVDDVTRGMKAAVSYAKYHIDGKPHHPGDTTPYNQPSTQGTSPFDSDEFKQLAIDKVEPAIYQQFKSRGIDISISTGVSGPSGVVQSQQSGFTVGS